MWAKTDVLRYSFQTIFPMDFIASLIALPMSAPSGRFSRVANRAFSGM
jgi:hypothetical protein